MNKELLGRIFTAYINIRLNPQSKYRKEATENLTAALDELQASGITFDEAIADSTCRQMLMLTDEGMENFRAFIQKFMISGYDDRTEMSGIAEEQVRLAKWVNEHRKELTE